MIILLIEKFGKQITSILRLIYLYINKHLFLITILLCLAEHSYAHSRPILVTTRPIFSIIKNISCNLPVKLLLNKNISPHNFHLKPSQLQSLYDASLIIITSKNLETSLFNIIKKHEELLKKTVILDEINGIKLIQYKHNKEFILLPTKTEVHHSHGSSDPHIWLSIKNVSIITTFLSRLFQEKYPSSSSCYLKKSYLFQNKLNLLNKKIDSLLIPLKNKKVIVTHDAYNYLFKKYQIEVEGVIINNHNTPPNLKMTNLLLQAVQENKVKCVLIEPQFNTRIIKKIFSNYPIHIAQTDIEWGPNNIKEDREVYIKMMLENANSIANCLKG